MNPTTQEVYDLVKQIKARVITDANGISEEDAGLVSATLAAWELFQQQTTSSVSQTNHLTIPLTFAEWANSYKLGSHADRFLAAAVYLLTKENRKEVDKDDIMKLYAKARWEKPKNPADVIGKAATKGFFTEAEEKIDGDENKKLWQLTRTGYEFFQNLSKADSNG